MRLDELTHKVIGLAMEIHRELGPGFVESIYHRSLEIELAAAGIPFESNVPITVFFKEKMVGKFEADFVIIGHDRLLLELKAVENTGKAHEVQMVNHLVATGIDHGLILDFGAASLQFRHKFRQSKSRSAQSSR